MNELLDFLEDLVNKNKNEYLYQILEVGTSIDAILSKETKYEIAKIIIKNKIRVKTLGGLCNMIYEGDYWENVIFYKELSAKRIQVHVCIAIDILEMLVLGQYSLEKEKFQMYRKKKMEENILRDEYTMTEKQYRVYTEKQ
ncbi:MAG: hypothetical protein ACRC41_06670 [Sarcina sp.]